MDEKVKKKNDFIHFIEKWFIIGIVLFVIIQLTAIGIVNLFIPKEQRVPDEQYEEYNEGYIGHWYNGTFFINMRVEDHFESQEKYEEMKIAYRNDRISQLCLKVGTICSIPAFILILVAAFRERKNKLLTGNTPIFIIFSGLLFLIYKVFEEFDFAIDAAYYRDYSNSFLTTLTYYPSIYLFLLPVLIILMGLIFRQKQRKDLKLSTYGNEKLIKGISISMLVVGISFILYRLGVRIYELINYDVNIRLPFYYFFFELPQEYAISSLSYTKLVILRLVKDLPVFVASFISLCLFFKIVMSSIKGNMLSEKNNKYYKIIFISLIISSVIFNVLGLLEVKLLNAEFLYQYSEAVYTIALRSLTEPLLYGFFIYLFKHYIEIAYKLNESK